MWVHNKYLKKTLQAWVNDIKTKTEKDADKYVYGCVGEEAANMNVKLWVLWTLLTVI